MANQGMSITIKNMPQVKKLFEAKARKIKNMAYPMNKIAMLLHKSVLTNFTEQGRPKKWEGLKDSTRIARRKGGGSGTNKILMDTGSLRQSITSVSDNNEAKVGTNLIYARVHQFGHKGKRIPARPFVMLQDSDRKVIEKIVVDYLK